VYFFPERNESEIIPPFQQILSKYSSLRKINQYSFESFFFSSINSTNNTKEILCLQYYSYRYILDNVILFHPISELISMPRMLNPDMDRSYDVLQAVYGIFNIGKILLRNSPVFFHKKIFYTVRRLDNNH